MHGQRMGEKGVALVIGLIITMVAFLVVGTTLYLVVQSTSMSGAGKTYATVEECSDGVFMIAKDYLKYVQRLDVPPDVFTSPYCKDASGTYTSTLIENAIFQERLPDCWATLSLPGALGTTYEAKVMFKKMHAGPGPGGRIVFGEQGGGGARSISQFYRVVTRCRNLITGATAENSVQFRFVGD